MIEYKGFSIPATMGEMIHNSIGVQSVGDWVQLRHESGDPDKTIHLLFPEDEGGLKDITAAIAKCKRTIDHYTK